LICGNGIIITAIITFPRIITRRLIKSRTMRWAMHLTRMGRKAYRVLVRKTEGRRPLQDLDVGERIILRWILER
jgi:hypothetical protein